MPTENAPDQGDASIGRKSGDKKPPHECFGCDKEYARTHKRLQHMRDCCPEKLETCPDCGVGYTNTKGLRFHHGREHDGSISKVDINCERCGEFYKRVYKSVQDNYTFCKDCRNEARSERVSGENNPMHGAAEKVEFDCEHCGEHHVRNQSASSTVFCDVECRDAYLHTQRGEDHPMWNGGKDGYYGPDWPEQRRKALERDNYRCQACGESNEETSIALNAHHIQPYKSFDTDAEANKVDNLVCLCISCHRKWEGLPVKPQLL